MKIQSLSVENFKGLKKAEIKGEDLGNLTVLSGKNGTGKTSLLEAIYLVLDPSVSSDNREVVNSWVHSAANEAKISIVLKLNPNELNFFKKEVQQLVNKGVIGDPLQGGNYSSYQDNTIMSKIILRRMEAEERGQPSERQSFLSTTNSNKIHPIKILTDRGYKIAVFFNAYRQVEISSLQLFSQAPPSEEEETRRLKMPSIGADALRKPINLQPIPELNTIILKEIFSFLKSPTLSDQINERLLPHLKVLNKLILPKEIEPPEFIPETNRIEYEVRVANQRHSIKFLSAGENEVLMLATYLLKLKTLGYKPIVLIDEPELHLHPMFVQRFANFIEENILKETEGNILIASHSGDFIHYFPQDIRRLENGELTKIKGMKKRKELFEEIGQQITPSALVDRIVFVEGSKSSRKKLPDEEIYQTLLDPNKDKTFFVSSGDRLSVRISRRKAEDFLASIESTVVNQKLFAIMDGNSKIFEKNDKEMANKNILQLPVYSVENLLLVPKAIQETLIAFGVESFDVNEFIKSLLPDLIPAVIGEIKKDIYYRSQKTILGDLEENVLELLDQQNKREKLKNSAQGVEKFLTHTKAILTKSINNGTWQKYFIGELVLRKLFSELKKKFAPNFGEVSFAVFEREILKNLHFEDLPKGTKNILRKFYIQG